MSQSTLDNGTLIAERFEVLSPLGEGGYSVVYKARQRSTGQPVAIKLLREERFALSARNPEAETARFHREMELIARLKHPNIVRLIDSGTMDGQHFTVLEFVDGHSLFEVLRDRGALSIKLTSHLMFQVLDALAYAHGQGVVHRDLKPHNIMMTTGGYRPNAMVLDFGIASVIQHARDEDYQSLTQPGQVPGTPSYMSPEMLSGQPPTPQLDIYAWGLVFLECLVGAPIITGESNALTIFKQLSSDPVPIPQTLHDTALGQLLARATAKSPEVRYKSAHHVLADLEACQSELASLPAHPSGELIALDFKASLPIQLGLGDIPHGGQTPPALMPTEAALNTSEVPSDDESDEALQATRDAIPVAPVSPPEDNALTPALSEPAPLPPTRSTSPQRILLILVLLIGAALLIWQLSQDPTRPAPLDDTPSPPPTTSTAKPTTPTPTIPPTAVVDPAPTPEPETLLLPASEVNLGLTSEDIQKILEDPRFAEHAIDLGANTAVLEPQRWTRSALQAMTYEVTWEDWNTTDLDEISGLCPDSLPQPLAARRPVLRVAPREAEAFCAAHDMRLPTLREWEALARGPSGADFATLSGEPPNPEQMNALALQTDRAELPWSRTPEGLFDLLGSVREWVRCPPEDNLYYCQDGYAIRGGSTLSGLFWMRSAITSVPPSSQAGLACARLDDVGFRCVRETP